MKTDGRRVARAEKEVQAAVADFLIKSYQGDYPSLVSVSKVHMPSDLRTARVFISVFDVPMEKQKEVVAALQKKAGEVQHHLVKRITMKFCPKITFEVDTSTTQVLKIEKILDDLAKERKASEPKDGGVDE
ncbi:MAG: 30S ribosome-binding factor RbfA [Bdellovibrionota bacterium]